MFDDSGIIGRNFVYSTGFVAVWRNYDTMEVIGERE